MAETEVAVVVKPSGFDALAADAAKAEAALKAMGAAVRGTNGAGAAAAKVTNDLTKAVNGAAIGTRLGNQIRSSMAAAMGSNGFWQSTFGNIGSRFGQLGKTVGNSIALGIKSALNTGITSGNLLDTAILGAVVYKTVDEAINAAAQRQGAVYRLGATRLLDGGNPVGPQQAALVKLAEDLAKKYPNTTVADNVAAITSTLQITGDTGEFFTDDGRGPELSEKGRAELDHFARLRSFRKNFDATHGTASSEAIQQQFDAAIRSGELMGYANDPEKNAAWVEDLTDISLASGVSPTEILAAQRTAGLPFLTLSPEARRKFVAMIQENRSSAGVQLATAFQRIVSGNNQTKQANAMLQKLHLLPSDPAQLAQLAKEGRIKLAPDGHSISHVNDPNLLKDAKQFAIDPFSWAQHDLLPGLRQAILTETGKDIGDHPTQSDEGAIVSMLQKIGGAFKDRNAAKFLAEMLIQASNIDKRARNMGAMKIDPKDQNGLFAKALSDFEASATDMGGDVGTTILPKVTSTLEWLSGVMRSVGQFAKDNPGLTTSAMYGAGGIVGLGGVGVTAYLMRGLLFPLKLVGGLIEGFATMIAGLGVGVYDLVGGAAATGTLGKTAASASKWLAASGTIGKILGTVGRLMSVLGTILLAYDAGRWATSTQTGQSVLDTIQKGWNHWLGGDKISHGNAQLEAEARWKSNNMLDPYHLIHRDTPPPSYLDLLQGDRAKYSHFARNREWLKHIQPVEGESSWMPRGFGGSRNPNHANGANPATPMPVVVTQMPKADSRPNQISTTVNVNVQSNASPQEIGGAVGSAVGSKVSNALSDQHH